MDELLKQLLESELLSADTVKDLEKSLKEAVEQNREAVRTELEEEMRIADSIRWVEERDALLEAMESTMIAKISEELSGLKEDILKFRDLDIEYTDKLAKEQVKFAEKLTEEKQVLREELETDMQQLVTGMSSFLEMRLNAEITELQTDIKEAHKNHFGRKIYEAYAKTFQEKFAMEQDGSESIADMQTELQSTKKELTESKKELSKINRSNKMTTLLGDLTGKQRDMMEHVLSSVPTDTLEEGFQTFLPKILDGSDDKSLEKESSQVLAEKQLNLSTKLATGDKVQPSVITEEHEDVKPSSKVNWLKEVAGI